MLTFRQVLDHFGGKPQDLAKALGITRSAVAMWRGQIPELRAMQIEVLTAGELKAADMPTRPSHRSAA